MGPVIVGSPTKEPKKLRNQPSRPVLALTILSGIASISLAITYVLMEFWGGAAALKFQKMGLDLSFGGSFALFLGLYTSFLRSFKFLVLILSVIQFLILTDLVIHSVYDREGIVARAIASAKIAATR